MARTKGRQKSRGARGARGVRGPRGRRGAQGRQGATGPPAQNGEVISRLGNVLTRVTQELEAVQNTLKVQFTRIAELQADLDDVRVALTKSK